MSAAERFTLILLFVSVIGIPTLVLVARISRWRTRIEMHLADLVGEVKDIVKEEARWRADQETRVSKLERSELEWRRRADNRATRRAASPPAGPPGT